MKVKYLKLMVWFLILAMIILILASFLIKGTTQIFFLVAAGIVWVISQRLNKHIKKILSSEEG